MRTTNWQRITDIAVGISLTIGIITLFILGIPRVVVIVCFVLAIALLMLSLFLKNQRATNVWAGRFWNLCLIVAVLALLFFLIA